MKLLGSGSPETMIQIESACLTSSTIGKWVGMDGYDRPTGKECGLQTALNSVHASTPHFCIILCIFSPVILFTYKLNV